MSDAEQDAILAQLVRDRRETRRLLGLADTELHALLHALKQPTHPLRERLLRGRRRRPRSPESATAGGTAERAQPARGARAGTRPAVANADGRVRNRAGE